MRFFFLLVHVSLADQLASATSVHVRLLSRKELPSGRVNIAHSTHPRDEQGMQAHEGTGLTLLESMTTSLNNWGSQAAGGEPNKLQHHLPNDPDSFSALHRQRTQKKASLGKFATILVVVAISITVLSFVCACFGRWWDADDEANGPDPTLSAVENCNGPWARVYRESQGDRREAIELLFKCNIITMPEFANYAVSRQHSNIDDCIQIGVKMLQERTVKQWEARWQEAQKTFDNKSAQGGFQVDSGVLR